MPGQPGDNRKVTCAGLTKSGRPCRSYPMPDGRFCSAHADQAEGLTASSVRDAVESGELDAFEVYAAIVDLVSEAKLEPLTREEAIEILSVQARGVVRTRTTSTGETFDEIDEDLRRRAIELLSKLLNWSESPGDSKGFKVAKVAVYLPQARK